ncbi:hypothetical protein G8O18_14015 [Enterobacter kobei]|uniref:hypothetical protein n=1 Tax=Enterobacter kobei TaxID=208224 RepID=UPI002F2C332E
MKAYVMIELDDGYANQDTGIIEGAAFELVRAAIDANMQTTWSDEKHQARLKKLLNIYAELSALVDGHGESAGAELVKCYDLEPKEQAALDKIFRADL